MLRNNSQTLGTLWLFCDPDLQNRPAQNKKATQHNNNNISHNQKEKEKTFSTKVYIYCIYTRFVHLCVCRLEPEL